MFKILVVEDDKDLNRTVCAFLNASGYQATGCLDANDAYDAMYGTMFDLIVSDIMMPGIDGFEFARTVRGLNENIPILFMTARDDFASKQRGYRIGVDDYMVKPIDLDELFLRIGALLRRAKIASSRKLEGVEGDVIGEAELLIIRREVLSGICLQVVSNTLDQSEILLAGHSLRSADFNCLLSLFYIIMQLLFGEQGKIGGNLCHKLSREIFRSHR